jgi:hypothetical protein
LLREDRTEIPFLDSLCNLAVKIGGQHMNLAALNWPRVKMQEDKLNPKSLPDAVEISIDCHKFELDKEDIGRFFETTHTPLHIPNLGGWTYLWPSNERFIILTDCDDVSFIAGDRKEILGIMGVDYDYCVARVRKVYEGWLKDWSAVNAELAFCDEFAK